MNLKKLAQNNVTRGNNINLCEEKCPKKITNKQLKIRTHILVLHSHSRFTTPLLVDPTGFEPVLS